MLSVVVNATKFNCQELTTPRIFGGKYGKATEYLSVAMDSQGNMLAGGYSMDNSIFVGTIR